MNDAPPPRQPSDVAFTPSVKAAQTRLGSRPLMARNEREHPWRTVITDDLAQFLEHIDSFFLATATADGQPYIQHRGGPPGFLKPLDEKTLGFADFGGNRQYVSVGNLAENDRAHIFLLHYATKQRVKLWGRARIVEGNEALQNLLAMPGYRARIERVILFELTAWDANCQQHITARYSEAEIAPGINKLVARIQELEAEVARLGGTKPAD
ncbi:MAG: pyridoxamine 5'-phosphate oxidase family protein [Alphaproteobacteria bacterium]|nr:pyridoxamine 5'-phosphate oxidase family protein [Alphaproteobacteria bacterium]